MKIKLIQTGGTIDKDYNMSNGELFFTSSHIKELLDQGRNKTEINFETLALLDSLQMSKEYRENIVSLCGLAQESQIIVTHGTDTMVETAIEIAKVVKDKSIVLTGAMIPYSIKDSDALFNLGCAITAVQLVDPGVYIAMNGKVFPYDQVKKDRSIGVFVSI